MQRGRTTPLTDQDLAAIAVNALAALTFRWRERQDYELMAFVRDGAKAIETRVLSDERTTTKRAA